MQQIKQKLHLALPPTTVWGYNGMYPGPTFDVRRDHPILVKWENKLPFKHLLPVDTTLHGAEPSRPPVRTVVHLHGGVFALKMTDIQKHGLPKTLKTLAANSCMKFTTIRIVSVRQLSGITTIPLESLD